MEKTCSKWTRAGSRTQDCWSRWGVGPLWARGPVSGLHGPIRAGLVLKWQTPNWSVSDFLINSKQLIELNQWQLKQIPWQATAASGVTILTLNFSPCPPALLNPRRCPQLFPCLWESYVSMTSQIFPSSCLTRWERKLIYFINCWRQWLMWKHLKHLKQMISQSTAFEQQQKAFSHLLELTFKCVCVKYFSAIDLEGLCKTNSKHFHAGSSRSSSPVLKTGSGYRSLCWVMVLRHQLCDMQCVVRWAFTSSPVFLQNHEEDFWGLSCVKTNKSIIVINSQIVPRDINQHWFWTWTREAEHLQKISQPNVVPFC